MECLKEYTLLCPYCGEEFETTIDCSAGSQQYIEDCYVCCRPIQMSIQVEAGCLQNVEVWAEDE